MNDDEAELRKMWAELLRLRERSELLKRPMLTYLLDLSVDEVRQEVAKLRDRE